MKNLTKSFLILMMMLGVAFITSCSKDDEDNFQMNNQDFVTRASSSNMLEIAAGNLAVQKSANADVKAFGQHMVSDHGKAATEMASLAQQKGWTIPTNMLPEHQTMLNNISNLTGAEFDKQFAIMMVTSHQSTIALFEEASSNDGVSDNDLRAMASAKLPTLKHHLEEAQQVRAKVNP